MVAPARGSSEATAAAEVPPAAADARLVVAEAPPPPTDAPSTTAKGSASIPQVTRPLDDGVDATGPAADAAMPFDASPTAPKPPPPSTPSLPSPAVQPPPVPPPPSPPSVNQAPGELAVLVTPYATLWLDGKPVGETPYRVSLPAGRHTLRLVNEERSKDEWVPVTITPGRTVKIERNW
jgi:serine/threonine-protein kinase